MKETKVLLEQGKIDTDVLMIDEVYLQKIHNTKMGTLLVLTSKEICTKEL